VRHRAEALAAAGAPLVAWAWRRIAKSRGAIDIGGLAKDAGFSRKHLVAQFRAHVGLPPKRIARFVRFDAVIRHLDGATPTETRDAVAQIGDRFG
jgi:methylphosphotriester-DNA--protein-cysteine methyltransferase